jgi:hypothetical protein
MDGGVRNFVHVVSPTHRGKGFKGATQEIMRIPELEFGWRDKQMNWRQQKMLGRGEEGAVRLKEEIHERSGCN